MQLQRISRWTLQLWVAFIVLVSLAWLLYSVLEKKRADDHILNDRSLSLRATFSLGNSEVRYLFYSNEGELLVAGDLLGNIKIWDVESHNVMANMIRPVPVYAAAFIRSANRLALLCSNNKLRIMVFPDLVEVAEITVQTESSLRGISVSKDGRHIVLFSIEGNPELIFIDLHFLKKVTKVKLFSNEDRGFPIMNLDRTRFLTLLDNNQLAIRSTLESNKLQLARFDGDIIFSGAINRQRMLIAYPRYDQVDLVQFDSLSELCHIDTPGMPKAVAYSPDGIKVAIGCNSNRPLDAAGLIVYDLSTETIVARFMAHSRSVGAVAFSPDSRYLASGGGDSEVKIWRMK